MVRALADKGFVEDYIFWEKFAFKYVFTGSDNKETRQFSHSEAKKLWDSFVYLKLKCPTIDIKDVLMQLEKFIEIKKIDQVQVDGENQNEQKGA